jgi:hypothetical protein
MGLHIIFEVLSLISTVLIQFHLSGILSLYTPYGAETWTLRKLDQKYLESFEMWCRRRMEKISWTDRVNNEAVLHRVKEERNILHTVKRKEGQVDWAHIA